MIHFSACAPEVHGHSYLLSGNWHKFHHLEAILLTEYVNISLVSENMVVYGAGEIVMNGPAVFFVVSRKAA